jgi:type IV fimbrial biogenesis protein FimT
MDVDHSTFRRSRGMTFVELTAVIAIIGISLAILAPSWSGMVQRNRVTTSAHQLLAHLRYARNEAVTRRAFVSLCPSVDGSSCTRDTRGWHHGYLVFEDQDGDRRRAANEPLLRVQNRAQPGIRLQSTSGRPAVRFRADGAAWSTNTTFSICHSLSADRPDSNLAVILYGSGRARIDRRAPRNRAISCS